MGVTSIASLHMTTGTLSTLGYLYVSWKDELLAWNSSDYCDLSRLTVTPTDIWVPRLVQFGGMETEYSLSPAWLHSNGRVDWLIASSFEGTCILDVRLFPFDKHECGFFIQPTAHDASEIELKLLSNASAIGLLAEHGEWDVTESTSTIATYMEPISNMSFIAFSLVLKLSRRYQFVVIHTSIPYSMLSLLNTMIFVVPLRSGERVTFSVTILLAFVFFTSDVSEQLPRTSLNISYVSIGMVSLNVATTLGIITSVILCRMDYEIYTPLPDWLKRLTLKYLNYRRRRKTTSTTVNPLPAVVNEIENKRQSISDENNLPFQDFSQEDVKWTHVANMLDYILFHINFVLMVALGMGSFIVLLTA